jgi:hypothetical protein
MTRSIFIFLLFVTVSCQKEYTVHASEESTAGMAFLKIIHASPNFRALTGQQDTFNIYIGGLKVNGATFTYNSIFPAAGTNTYMAVEPGLKEIRLTVPGVVKTDSVNIYSFNKQMEAGKYYTFMITDSINAASRDSSRIFVEDSYSTPPAGYISIRFIHTVMNDTVDKKVDLFSYAKNSTIISNVSRDSVSSYISLGYNLQTVDTFYVTRAATSGTALSARIILAKQAFTTTNIVGATDQRCFTLYYKGNGNLTTGTKPRALAGFVH